MAEMPWDGGPPDWAGMEDPVAALYRKGSLAYAIDVPGVTDVLALAYDSAWPLLRDDDEWIARAGAQGLSLADAGAGCQLIEEALCCLLQCAVDGAALSNKPRTSLGQGRFAPIVSTTAFLIIVVQESSQAESLDR